MNYYFNILLLPLFLGCVLNIGFAQDEDVDWIQGQENIYEDGLGSPIVGTRWGLASLRDGHQLTLKLEASNDMKRGGWSGDFRSKDRVAYFKLERIEESGTSLRVNYTGPYATGPDSDPATRQWKNGVATMPAHLVEYGIAYDELFKLKGNSFLKVTYSTVESQDKIVEVLFPLASFSNRFDELKTTISNVESARQFILTSEEIQNNPIKSLPQAIRNSIRKDLENVIAQLELSMDQAETYSIEEIKALRQQKEEQARAEKKAKLIAKHKKIYDLEPDWKDLNVCPRDDVEYCHDIGKIGYESNPLIGKPFKYGEIIGVVWRSKDSIVRIYGGVVDLGIEPDIYRAKEAAYYYIVQNDKGYLDIRKCE